MRMPNKKKNGKKLRSFIESKLKNLRFIPKAKDKKAKPAEEVKKAVKSAKVSSKKISSNHAVPLSQVPAEPQQVEMHAAPVFPQERFEHPIQNLPYQYGDNMIYLLVRDPYWIYAYWEIQKDHQERMLGSLGGSWAKVKSVLRVYDFT